jgi:ubiquinone/menaquinone biosynthesis C-methylase UbiE
MKLMDPRNGYNSIAKEYRKEYSHLDSFDWDKVWFLIGQILSPQTSQCRILDAGCGDGRALVRIQRLAAQRGIPAQFWGWDIAEAMLQQTQKRLEGPATLIRRDIAEPASAKDYPPEGFNLVTAMFVLVHLEDPADFLNALYPCMAPGGKLICNTIPQRQGYSFGKGKDAVMIDFHHHEADWVAQRFLAAGWNIEQRIDGEWSTVFEASPIAQI